MAVRWPILETGLAAGTSPLYVIHTALLLVATVQATPPAMTGHNMVYSPEHKAVLLIGGSAGIGLETARRARAEGANVILTARNPEPLRNAASEVGAQGSAPPRAGALCPGGG